MTIQDLLTHLLAYANTSYTGFKDFRNSLTLQIIRTSLYDKNKLTFQVTLHERPVLYGYADKDTGLITTLNLDGTTSYDTIKRFLPIVEQYQQLQGARA